jgi:hypothetical protein
MGVTKINGKTVKANVVTFDGVEYTIFARSTVRYYKDGDYHNSAVAVVTDSNGKYHEVMFTNGEPSSILPVKVEPVRVIETAGIKLMAVPVEPVSRTDGYAYSTVDYAWIWTVTGEIAGKSVTFDPVTVARLKSFFSGVDTDSVGEVQSF